MEGTEGANGQQLGFAPGKPGRWPVLWLDQLDRQIVRVLAEDNPQSVRHCFYRMVDPRLPVYVPKSDAGYRRVQKRVLKLRRSGVIPWGHVSDSTRMGWHTYTYGSPGEYLASVAGLYRRDLWANVETLVEVWCESRSIAGVLTRDCKRLAVSLYPCGGFASATLAHEAASYVNSLEPARLVILYVGDYDPAGVIVDRAVERELRSHLDVPMDFHRLAVNPEQIEAMGLPGKPRSRGDRRRLDIELTTEAEAMPAGVLRRMVRERVESYLPPGALEAAQAAERSERKLLLSLSRWERLKA